MGSPASIMCAKPGKAKREIPEDKIGYKGQHYTRFLKLDPGLQYCFGGIAREEMLVTQDESVGQQDLEEVYLTSSANWHYRTSFHGREKRRKRMTGKADAIGRSLIYTYLHYIKTAKTTTDEPMPQKEPTPKKKKNAKQEKEKQATLFNSV